MTILRPLIPALAGALLALGGCGADGERLADEAPAAAEPSEGLRFTHVTEEAGLGAFRHVTGAFGEMWFPETMGAGAGFLDYDGDGWQDIALVAGGAWPGRGGVAPPAVRLYRNEGGYFREVTGETGLANVHAYGMGLAIADYDNDGDPDIFLTALGRNLLLRNDRSPDAGGQVLFSDVTQAAGLADDEAWSTSAIFFDADLDGRVDLYVANYVAWSPETDMWCTMNGRDKTYCTPKLYDGVPSRFYRNEGGVFADRTAEAGFLPAPGKTLGAAEWDFNEDGWPDLVAANDTQRDLLYMNDGTGAFVETGVASGVAYDADGQARAGMGVDVGVLDGTGAPSVVVGHFANEPAGLYRQMAPGVFVDRAAQSQVGLPSLPTLTFGLCLFDADLDGDLDIFLANGHISPDVEGTAEGLSYRQAPQLFLNDGDGFFSEYAFSLAAPMVARGAALADYDRDGDEDVLVTENAGPVHLLRNETQGGASVRVRLEGVRSARDALGAQVTAVAGARRMTRRVRTGSSYLVSSEKALTFGLGGAAQADTLIVEWPGGDATRHANIPAGREVHIVEGSGIAETVTQAGRDRP